MRARRPGEAVSQVVVDFSDAFHSLLVHPEDCKYQLAAGSDGQFLGYRAVVFGGEGSPMVWGRDDQSRTGQNVRRLHAPH
eukprot:5264913-Heterocapsa_arctica.AAC.1